jgi:4-amino-4-deoxy-L-arabinose transferase-like glycosyltransferase
MFLLRFALSPNLNGAEAREMLFGQSLQWGYRPNDPPLAMWLSWAALAIGQGSRLALFLLREVVLAIGLIAFFAASRTVLGSIRQSGLAAFFLLATFGISWLAQHAELETVLLATMCCLYLWADTRALAHQRTIDYLVLGAVTGLGVLSSYVFLVLPFAMSVALAFTPELRARLRLLPLIEAALAALVIVAPYFGLAPDAVKFTVGNMRAPALTALRELAVALVVFALPAALLFLILYPRAGRPLASREGTQGWLRFFRIAMLASAIAAIVVTLAVRGEVQALAFPVLLPLSICLFLRAQLVYGDGTDWSDRRFVVAVLACVVAAIGIRAWLYETRAHDCRHCAEYWPLARYADTFRQAGFLGGTIAAPDAALAGNLRLVFPDARAVTPDAPALRFGPPVTGECLVVWEGNGSLPQHLGAYVETTYGAKLRERAMQGDVESALLTSKGRLARMNFLILAQGACDRPRG